MNYKIEDMKFEHWNYVKAIYNDGIKTGIATFQSKAPSWEEWDSKYLEKCRFVAVSEDEVLGWVALSPTSSRACYSGVAEVSVYINSKHKGKGVGKALLNEVIMKSEENEIWSLYSAIFRENVDSIFLHEKCGFRKIGIREKIAKTPDGIWHDTVLMERRSRVIGV